MTRGSLLHASLMGAAVMGALALLGARAAPCRAAEAARVAALSPDAARDMAVRWWRWRLALPELATPEHDPAGHFCDVGQSDVGQSDLGQSGDAWFLAGHLAVGAQSRPTRRACAVPVGRRLFFPVTTLFRFVYGAVTCEGAKALVRDGLDHVQGAYVRVDGADAPLAMAVRAGTPDCEPLAIAGATAPAFLSAMDGIWLMLEPLPPGRHVLQYGSGTGAGGPTAGQVQETTYDLDVR